MADIASRLTALDWAASNARCGTRATRRRRPLLTPDECAELIAPTTTTPASAAAIDMARYRFGVGDYKYFADPLPPLVQALRSHAYPPLAAIANQFEAALDTATLHPPDLAGLLALCHRRGQTKPTPLLLHYEAGGYNCLHQDLYGDVVFPLQLTCFLSRRGRGLRGRRLPAAGAAARAPSRAASRSPPSRARS